MEAFRTVYALHFVLGIFLAIRLWIYTPAILGLIADLHISFRDAVSASSVSILSLLWYFIWYGSIKFATTGSFPLLPVRPFAIVFAIVYGGSGLLVAYIHQESLIESIQNRTPLFLIIALMLALAGMTAIALPKVKLLRDIEAERINRVREEQLDQMYRCNNPRIGPNMPRKN